MTATRIKNDFYGIKALFRYAEVLSGLAISNDATLPRAPIKAIGRHIMTPYYKHYVISAVDILDSNRSKNKLEDLQHAILNYIVMLSSVVCVILSLSLRYKFKLVLLTASTRWR